MVYKIWVNSRTFCISAKYEYKLKLHYSDGSAQLSGLLQEITFQLTAHWGNSFAINALTTNILGGSMCFILHSVNIKQFCAQASWYRPYQFLTPWCNLQIRTLSKCSQTTGTMFFFLCNSNTVSAYGCTERDPRFSRQSKKILSVCWVSTLCSLLSRYKPFSATWCLCLQGGRVHLYALLLVAYVFRAEVHFYTENEEGSRTVGTPFYPENEYNKFPRNNDAYLPDQTESRLYILPLMSKSLPEPRMDCSLQLTYTFPLVSKFNYFSGQWHVLATACSTQLTADVA